MCRLKLSHAKIQKVAKLVGMVVWTRVLVVAEGVGGGRGSNIPFITIESTLMNYYNDTNTIF
jgi:hypothetical protein